MNTEPNTNRLSELDGIKAEFGMRTTVYCINICSPVHSLGISCYFHLSLSFNCVKFSVVWPHNKQIPTSWLGFIVQRASLSFRHASPLTRIDSNGRHGDYCRLDTGDVLRLSSEAMLYTKNLRGNLASACGRMIICACQEFSAHAFATVYMYHRNKVFY